MNIAPLDGLDLNLLVTLAAVLRAESVSDAARALGKSQPTVSRALAQLRIAFDDPLLVRTGRGMELTPTAVSLQEPLRHALGSLERLRQIREFDPATDNRTFRIMLPDVLGGGSLTTLHQRMQVAPKARLTVVGYEGDAETRLLGGKVDLVVGALDLKHPDFYTNRTDRPIGWSVIAGPLHVAYGGRMTKKRWLASQHVQLVPGERPEVLGLVDEFLRDHGLERDVVIRIGYLHGLAQLVASTRLVATLPTPTARFWARHRDVRVFPHPLKSLPRFHIKMTWHATQHRDPGYRWFRDVATDTIRDYAERM